MFFNGKKVARKDLPGRVVSYYFSDNLGTASVITNSAGTIIEDEDFYPWGGEFPFVNSDSNHYKFTGKERDTETGLDYFGARYYGNWYARFLSADPVVITPERMPDPQELNRYSYVRDNPLRFTDPTGEKLEASGDLQQDQATLCSMAGVSDCSRIAINQQTGQVSFNTQGLDLSQNEGVTLLNQLVTSSDVYGFALSDTVQTAGGSVSVDKDLSISNLDDRPDDRYSKGKTPTDLPPKGVNDQVTINPKTATFTDSQGRSVSLSSLSFHELAEAYAKVDGGKAYGDFMNVNVVNGNTLQIGPQIQQGAHNEAVQREFRLREQRPNLKSEGRAGDVLIREPHN